MPKASDNIGDIQAEGVRISSAQKNALDSLSIPPDEKITVHMVHLNHLDLTWFWRLPDTIEMCLETIRWHVDLLEKHPDARYSHTQVFTLSVVEQVDYPLFRRFAGLVEEGRIEIDSGQYVEPDHNIPSGESLARQFLYGQLYLQSRFGIRARTLVNSDSFGHARSLPQIMKLAGIEHMIFKRPRQRFRDLPETPFLWKGINGSTIPALRFINKGAGLPSLSQWHTLPEGRSELQEKIDRNLAAGIHHLFGSHCGSDAGGATAYVEPVSGEGYELRYSTPSAFFAAVLSEGSDLPVVDGLLNYVYQGCYTTHIEEKEHHRRAERELRELELLWTLVSLRGEPYPDDAIASNWMRCSFLQFHDILPGTGSPEAHADNTSLYQEMFLSNNLLRRKAQLILDRCCPGSGAARSFLVANPRPYPSGGVAAVDVEMPVARDMTSRDLIPLTGLLEDDEGRKIPYQITDTREFGRYVRGTMIFSCPEVPALGLKSLRMTVEEAPASGVYVRGSVLENEHLRVEVGGPGILRSVITLKDGQERLRPVDDPVRLELWPETEFIGDYGSPMQAWCLGITDAHEPAVPEGEVTVVEEGPVRATLRVHHRWGTSRFTTDVSLYAGQDWVEMRTEIDWHEKEVLCRLRVQPGLQGTPRRTYGIPFGTESATGEELEVPAVGWADMSDDDISLAVLNLDRPGHTFRDGCIRVSLVRCATGNYDPCTDSGQIRSTIRLLPHDGHAPIPQRSDEFSHPLVAWQSEASGEGSIDWKSPVSLEGEGVVLSSFKAMESGDGYILRFYESLGMSGHVSLVLGMPLKGCAVYEANIMEDELHHLDSVGGRTEIHLGPFEIKTLILKTAKPLAWAESGCSQGLFRL